MASEVLLGVVAAEGAAGLAAAARVEARVSGRVGPREPADTGELAGHPEVLSSSLERLFLGRCPGAAHQVATVLRARDVSGLVGDLCVVVPDPHGGLDGRSKPNIWVRVACRELHRLLADNAPDQDAGMRLLYARY